MGMRSTGGGGGGSSASIWDLSGDTIIYGADATAANVDTLELGAGPSVTPLNQTIKTSDALAGTAVDTAGSSFTVTSGAGTGTGAASSIIFQTPTLAGAGTGAQAMATRLTIATTAVTATVPFVAPVGSAAAPSFTFTGFTDDGLFHPLNDVLGLSCNGNEQVSIHSGGSCIRLRSVNTIGWISTNAAPSGGTLDLIIARLGADNLRVGFDPSGTPAANTLTVGEASRPGTDVDIGGGNGTIQSGLGTGTGTASSLIFQTPTLAGAGSGAQSYATRLTIATASITATVPFRGADGSEAAPTYSFSSDADCGFYRMAGNVIGVSLGGTSTTYICFDGSSSSDPRGLSQVSLAEITWTNSTTNPRSSIGDLFLSRSAAATLQLGRADAAAPVAQILRSQGSRAGTDVDVAGGNLTIQSGTGTGAAAGSSLILRVPIAVGAGSGAQTITTIHTMKTLTGDQMGAFRFQQAQGAAVASANNMVLGGDGNYFQISGTTQVNLIDNTNWQGGARVTLKFQGIVTVKDNQAASGNNKPIMLAGGVDLVTAANVVLDLIYDATDAAWFEVTRSLD